MVSVIYIEVTTRLWYEKQVADVIHSHPSDEFVIATCFAQLRLQQEGVILLWLFSLSLLVYLICFL
ncbi:hypothetical protein MIR68_012207 [Amoeboaphelidium protococcarum]|nr:hypothetical protein MIR68_012207 [Amoeboaphelidium protococcarum]